MLWRKWVTVCLSSGLAFASAATLAQDIVFGQSVALTGPASELGREMRLGAQIFFDKVNAEGGVKGKRIVLRTLDDGYEANRAAENTRKLVNDGDVHAFFGYVGTPTSLPSIAIATEARIPFFGAFTGAQGLREPFNRYVFNVRASYFDETELLVKQLVAEGVRSIAVFHQNDSYGQAGLAGVTRALQSRNMQVFATATVERNSNDVSRAVAVMLERKPEAVIMVSTYGSCAEFIKQTKARGLVTRYANVSFVGTKSLVKALGEDGRGVMISQVMPSPWAQRYPWVQEYQRLIKAKGEEPSYTSLEGFLAARIAVDALRRGGDVSREAFVRALEGMREMSLDGFRFDFGPTDHNALQFVELTVIGRDGKIHY
ncbi:MAG: ABC transporter permease [Burkholderiales bacterium]|nr:MAG: ABC transporter permease [Burkholderiales bacterium]TAG77894.1 MAG: ABC transporter permease [Betaproteobacteria bacterium]